MLKRLICKLFLGLILLAPGVLLAADLEALLVELKQTAEQTETLTSHFVQEKRLAMFKETLVSEGRFVYQKPDRLRWELLSPVASGFVLQGKEGQRWNSLSQESGRFSVESDPVMGIVARQLLAWARVDMVWLQQRYRLELENESPLRLRLYPFDPGEASFIDHLQVLFAPDRSHVAEVLMVERGGDSTLMRFSEVVVNSQLAADTFESPVF